MKECRKCNAVLPDEDFYANSRVSDGLSSYCKECTKAVARHHYQQQWYSGNNTWYQQHLRNKEARARRTAERKGLMKKCSKCGEEKPATREHFYTGASKHGLKSYCKPCDNALKSERRRAKKEAKKQ
jgi:hypothetical protein